MSKINSTPPVTVARLREILHYNQETGVFTYKVKRGRLQPGSIAGATDKDGYIEICVYGRRMKAHRLAWFYVHGVLPVLFIDHINRVKGDNRIANLREASPALNGLNATAGRKNNALGVLGVHQVGDRFIAQIACGVRKKKCLGKFDTVDEASAAYQQAKAARDATAVIG